MLDSQEELDYHLRVQARSRGGRWYWILKRAQERSRAGRWCWTLTNCWTIICGTRRDKEERGGAGPSREPRTDQEQGGGGGLRKLDNLLLQLFLNSSATDIVLVTLLRTAVETAISEVHKLLRNGKAPTALI